MAKHEITINLEGLTADSRVALEKALISSLDLVDDQVNRIAMERIKRFKKEKFNKNESDFETM